MPSKHPSRTRTRTHSREHHQQRAWGTRFAYLETSPPPPIQSSSSPVPSQTDSSSPTGRETSSEELTRALNLELFGANAKATERRDWADDEVPSTLSSPGRTPVILNLAGGSASALKDTSKQPHNASVFVGSLPPNINEMEMARLLAQHLARFAKVQSIKIVHDSKGGLCAFVQCENASQATQLVSRAQANPQPFMGRFLRYENARARRTLWISYRTPMHFMSCASQDEEGPDIVKDESGVKGRWIESDLPDALRIWKPRDIKFPIVTFRGEARSAGDTARFDKDASGTDIAPAFRAKGILFTDLKFNEEMVRKMAEAFGPLESFNVLIRKILGQDPCAYPADHDVPRSRGMEPDVWEIKWEHRDNCITALNTLRRIPFLTVTWAKDSGPLQTPRVGSLHLRIPTSPHYSTAHTSRDTASPVVRGRPFLLLDCKSKDDGELGNADSPVTISSFARSPNMRSPQAARTMRSRGESAQRHPEEETEEGWTVVRSQNAPRPIASSLPGNASRSPTVSVETRRNVPDWTEGDFPPLTTERPRHIEMKLGEQKSEFPSSSAFISLNESDPSKQGNEMTSECEATPQRDPANSSRPPFNHRRSLSNPVPPSQLQSLQACSSVQKTEIPPTPELANSSLSETPTSAQAELESPTYPTVVPLAGLDYPLRERKLSERRQSTDEETTQSESGQSIVIGPEMGRYDHCRQTTIDPKAIFVGGLETFGQRPWDESRLREIFNKYGEIQEVKIVSPSQKKAGFAFVTFVDEQSTEKAIREEHNRTYDGRPIRVQIRDMFPQRGGFKYRGRGLGRRPFGFDARHDAIRHRYPTEPINRNAPMAANAPSASKPFEHQLAYGGVHNSSPFQVDPRRSHQLVPSMSAGTDSSTLRSLNSFDSKTEVDLSHESESKTTASLTPPPSSANAPAANSSFPVPFAPQTMPSAQGFYPSHAWMPQYGPHMHYPMSYGPPVQIAVPPAQQGTDPSAVQGNISSQWNPVYRPVSFAPYSYIIMPPAGTEMPHSANIPSQPTTPLKGQPPLHATGFIQGEHGVLYPVYQPEALNDYMSSTSPTQGTTVPRVPTNGSASNSSGPGQQQTNLVGAPIWPGYTHAPQFFPYSIPPVSAAGTTSSNTSTTAASQQANQQQVHARAPQVLTSAPSTMPMIANFAHAFPAQGQIATFAPNAQNVAPYFVGAPPGVSGVPTSMSRVGSQGGHTMHGITPERLHIHNNKHHHRRESTFHQGRNSQHGRAPVPDIPGARSPSGGPSNPARIDHVQNNHAGQQRQRQASTAPPLGLNKYIQDNGPSHQWMSHLQQ